MPFNLIDAAKRMIPQDLITKAAGASGESEQGISKALTAAIPAILIGLLGKGAAGKSSALLTMVTGAAGNNAWSNINSLLGTGADSGGMGPTVKGWLRSLFGDKLGKITDSIAGFAGIRHSSAGTALNMAAPATLGSLGKYVLDNELTAAGLSSFLQSQQSAIISSLPAGIDLAAAMNISEISAQGENIRPVLSAFTPEKEKKANPWLWLLTLLVAMLLIWLLSGRSCNQPKSKLSVVRCPLSVVR